MDTVQKKLVGGAFALAARQEHAGFKLTKEGQGIVDAGKGSPEWQAYNAVPAEGISMADLSAALGKMAKPGYSQCMQRKVLAIDKATKLVSRTDVYVLLLVLVLLVLVLLVLVLLMLLLLLLLPLPRCC